MKKVVCNICNPRTHLSQEVTMCPDHLYEWHDVRLIMSAYEFVQVKRNTVKPIKKRRVQTAFDFSK